MKILYAEDTKDLSQVVTAMLEMHKYEVDSVYDGEEALEKALKNGYDAVILDVMMPKKDGIEVLKELRARNIVTPVLMLTAKTEIDDRVEGLDSGADDYLTKPFAMKELLARVNALTRRGGAYTLEELSFGDVTLNPRSLELTASNTVRLSMKEFELMQTLMLNTDRTLDESYLMERIWKDEENATSETLKLYINFLKDKLGYINSSVRIESRGEDIYMLISEPED